MNKTLEERKAELEKELKESFTQKPRKWYQGASRYSYRTTNDYAQESYLNERVPFPIIIKNEFREHFFEIAFSIILLFGCLIGYLNSNDNYAIFFLIFSFLFFLYILKIALQKETYFTFTEEGINIEKEKIGIVKWENIIATYILINTSDDSTANSLLIYHHSTNNDTFLKTEYELKYIGINISDLCFYIEYWRIKTKNDLQNTKEQPN